MTHFVGAVIVPATVEMTMVSRPTEFPTLYGKDAQDTEALEVLEDYLRDVLARYDENVEVERWTPREELIAQTRADIEAYRTGIFAEYQANQVGYVLAHEKNPDHIHYLQVEFPQRLAWTDQQCWEYAVRYADRPSDIRPDGSLRETYNEDSKWDWWSIGGRWEQIFRDRQGESVSDFLTGLRATAAKLKAGENLNPHRDDPNAHGGDLPWHFPHNLITTDGKWHEIGETGWWGMRHDAMTEAEWVDLAIELLSAEDPNARVVYIDFHI